MFTLSPDETTEEKLSNSICKVNIFVTDANDNPPIFLKPSYSHVFSDIYQTSLLWLNATDPDVGVNAEVYFALAGVERVRIIGKNLFMLLVSIYSVSKNFSLDQTFT